MSNIGRIGEEAASKYLEAKGYRIRERNYRTYLGEIDIISEYRGNIIFVEVKTRSSNKFGYAEEAVNSIKQKKIIKNALYYLNRNRLWQINSRFDVIIISISNNKTIKGIKHIKNAFCLDSNNSPFN
ncbi:MAG: YraN family protein [Candidatus Atribacteria bacterium]|nr:YraN family protein [Candidatus Atribacteria bacterium]